MTNDVAAIAAHAADLYVRQRGVGRDDAVARAYTIGMVDGVLQGLGYDDTSMRAYVTAFVEGYLEGFAESYETGRADERTRLKALNDSYAAHGPDAQRWLMAVELGSTPDETVDPPEFTLSN